MPLAIGTAVLNCTDALTIAARQARQWWSIQSAECLGELETLRFLEQEVSTGRIKLVVVDNPNLDYNTIGLLSAVAEMERTQIRDRTKASLNRIKAEIAEKGSYTTRGGKTIKKLSNPVAAAEAAKKGRAHQIKLADERAEGPMAFDI